MLSAKDKRYQALIIDDDPLMLSMIAHELDTLDMDVHVAMDGLQAADRLQEGLKPDLIVVDMFMPDKEGLETIIFLKKKVPDTKIVAISGGGTFKATDVLNYAERLGACAKFTKPIDFSEFSDKIKSLL